MKSMVKKFFIITAFLILTIPVMPLCGAYQNVEIQNNDVTTQIIDQDIIDMIKMVNTSQIFSYLENFTNFGFKNTRNKNCEKAGEYIFNEFKKMGLDVYYDAWKFLTIKGKNIIATLNGTDLNSDAIFIVSAHYDTYNSPGSNDDGSGVAAMLTIANIISHYSFNYTVRFVAFSGHEQGTYGSFAYAKKAYSCKENIICVLNLDMIGNTTDDGKKIQLFKTDQTEWISQFTLQILEKYNEYIDLIVETMTGIPGADEASFLNLGFDAVLFHQPHSWLPEFHNHKPGDNMSTINFDFLNNVTKLILAVIVELAIKPITLQIRIETPYEGRIHIFDVIKFKLPGFNFYGRKIRGATYMLGGFTIKINITTDEKIDVVYCIIDDDVPFILITNESPYDIKISRSFLSDRRLNGFHNFRIIVTTTEGKTAMDEIDLFIL